MKLTMVAEYDVPETGPDIQAAMLTFADKVMANSPQPIAAMYVGIADCAERVIAELTGGMRESSSDELLALIQIQYRDFVVSNSTDDEPTIPTWYAFGGYVDAGGGLYPSGNWTVESTGVTLRECLVEFMAHENYGTVPS